VNQPYTAASENRGPRPLNELGFPFEHTPVIQGYRLPDPSSPNAPFNTTSPAFREISPAGQIPVIDDDGLILSQSLAINLYLAKKHPGPLSPGDLREDALMTASALWAATDCEPHTIQILYNRRELPEDKRNPQAYEAALLALERLFATLERTLRDGGGYLVGRRFTVADINAAEVFRYAQPATNLFAEHPSVRTWIEDCQSRQAFRDMMAARAKEPASNARAVGGGLEPGSMGCARASESRMEFAEGGKNIPLSRGAAHALSFRKPGRQCDDSAPDNGARSGRCGQG
jgi:glutathione S-transferase